jgi:hypothetical protein
MNFPKRAAQELLLKLGKILAIELPEKKEAQNTYNALCELLFQEPAPPSERHRGPPPFRVNGDEEREVWSAAYSAVQIAADHRLRSPAKEAENAVIDFRRVTQRPLVDVKLKPNDECIVLVNDVQFGFGGHGDETAAQVAIAALEHALYAAGDR